MRLRLLGCLSLLPVLVPAQQPVLSEARLAVQLPPYAAGTYVRSEAAFVGDDPVRDVVVLVDRGGSLDVCYMPDAANVSMLVPVASAVKDMAVWPGAGPGGRDAILVLSATGLRWYECAAGAQDPQERTTRFDATWASYERIFVGQKRQGAFHLFGSSAVSPAIRRAQWNQGWVDATPLMALPGATQVLTMDWDGITDELGGQDHEVVVRFGPHVYVLTWNSTAFWYFQFPVPPAGRSLLGVLPASGSEPSLLAAFGWLQSVGGGGPPSEYVLLVQRAGIAQLVSFGSVAAASMSMADMDGDGLVDVVLGDASTSRVHLVRRLSMGGGGSLPTQRAGHYALVAGEDRPDGAVDTLAATDFDGDGDGDLVGLQSANRLHHIVAGKAAPSHRLPNVRVEVDPQMPHTTTDNTTWQLHLPLSVALPLGWEALLADGETMEVQLTGWLQPRPTDWIEQAPRFADVRLPLEGQAEDAATTIDFVVDDLDPAAWSMWIRARFVAVGASGSRLLPSVLLHFTPSEAEQQLRESRVHGDVTGLDGSSEDGGDGNTLGGGEPNRNPGEPPEFTLPG